VETERPPAQNEFVFSTMQGSGMPFRGLILVHPGNVAADVRWAVLSGRQNWHLQNNGQRVLQAPANKPIVPETGRSAELQMCCETKTPRVRRGGEEC